MRLHLLAYASALCLLSSPTNSHGACWERTSVTYTPEYSTPPTYVCLSLFVVRATSKAKAESVGRACFGKGRAWDSSIFCTADVRTAVATGIYFEVWQNACEAPGEVEFEGEVHISGTADLIEEECAGAALGYQMITTNIAGPLRAALNESAGETTPQELGTVTAAHSGLGVSVPITVGSGVGTYMDSDQDVDAVLVCTDYFTIESKARAYIKVRANSTLIDLFAAVKTNMSSRSTTTIDFVTCPHKH